MRKIYSLVHTDTSKATNFVAQDSEYGVSLYRTSDSEVDTLYLEGIVTDDLLRVNENPMEMDILEGGVVKNYQLEKVGRKEELEIEYTGLEKLGYY